MKTQNHPTRNAGCLLIIPAALALAACATPRDAARPVTIVADKPNGCLLYTSRLRRLHGDGVEPRHPSMKSAARRF